MALHLPLARQFMLWMARKARIVHPLHFRMACQEMGHRKRARAMPAACASPSVLNAAQRKKRVKWARHCTQCVLQVSEPFFQSPRRGARRRRPADRIRVAVQILCGRMHDDVEAVLERPLNKRRGEMCCRIRSSRRCRLAMLRNGAAGRRSSGADWSGSLPTACACSGRSAWVSAAALGKIDES